MSIDPYSSPASFIQPGTPSNGGSVSQGVLRELAGTKPWVRFISVLMFIGAGLLVVFSLIVILMGSALAQMSKNPMFSGGVGVAIAVVYAVMAAFYI